MKSNLLLLAITVPGGGLLALLALVLVASQYGNLPSTPDMQLAAELGAAIGAATGRCCAQATSRDRSSEQADTKNARSSNAAFFIRSPDPREKGGPKAAPSSDIALKEVNIGANNPCFGGKEKASA